MRFLLGISTIAVAAAGFTMWLRPGAETELAVVSNVGRGGVATLTVPATATEKQAAGDSQSKPRFFGFALPPAAEPVVAASVPAASVVVAPPPTPAAAPPKNSWSNDVVVYAETQASEVAAPARVMPVASKPQVAAAPPSRDKPRAELVRDIQRELRRIGCYSGEVNGEWGANAKRALRAFMDHVGSRVQSDEPDLIQLTLVRGYSGVACRPANGQMMASKQPPLTPSVATGTSPAATQPAIQPRVAAGPVEQPQAAPSSVAAPLEGRMAVGGPVPEGGMPLVAGPNPPPKPRAAAAPRPRQDKAWLNNFFNN